MSKGRYGKSHDIVAMMDIAAVKIMAYVFFSVAKATLEIALSVSPSVR